MPNRRNGKVGMSFRLSRDARKFLEADARKLGVDMTAYLELLIRAGHASPDALRKAPEEPRRTSSS